MRVLVDVVLESTRIIAYMFSVVFSGYLVTNYNAAFLALFRNPFMQLISGFFLAMSMIDFRRNDLNVNLINLAISTICFQIMLFSLKKISYQYDKNEV